MELSTFCYILGVLYLVIAGPAIKDPHAASDWLLRIMDEEALMRIAGTVFLTISVLALSQGAALSMDLRGLIRLAAWMGVLKSLSLTWWPARYAGLTRSFFEAPGAVRLYGPLTLVSGVLFFWAGCILK